MNNLDCNRPLEALHISQYPIDTLGSMVDYILAERDLIDEATGTPRYSLVRVPALKLFPQGNMDNVIGVESNNTAIDVPENQVRAGYMQNTGNTTVMQFADTNHPAVFLILGKVADMTLIQNSGFVNIPEGHEYIIGQTYYLADDGTPTTDSSITGQKLFTPITRTTLAVQL